MEKFPLRSVRQMIWKDIKLCDHLGAFEGKTEKTRKEKVNYSAYILWYIPLDSSNSVTRARVS